MDPVRVFISYSHAAPGHRERVVELAAALRRDGVDAWIDRYSAPPAEGWPLWMERQIGRARWVLAICSESYRRRFEQQEEPGKGRGVSWEARLLRQQLYDAPGHDERIIPVVFDAGDEQHVPRSLAATSIHHFPHGYQALLRHIGGLPEIHPPPIGQPPTLVPASSNLPEAVIQSEGIPEEPIREVKAPTRASKRRKKRVLIVAANRMADPRLQLGREIREISTALRRNADDRYEMSILWAATKRDFRSAFLAVEPDILHFCGHGSPTHGPVLEQDDDDDERTTDAEALAQWIDVALTSQKRSLEIAVLNFCDSHAMLDTLARTAEVVVGPVRGVRDHDAVTFSSAFYLGLSAGSTGSFAFQLGCSLVDMFSCPSGDTSRQLVLADETYYRDASSHGYYGIRCRSASEVAFVDSSTKKSRTRPPAMAFFASEPENHERTHADRQIRDILRVVPQNVLRVEQRWATRAVDFLQALLEARPSIVHICGHGSGSGDFLFEDCRAPCSALARAMSLFHEDIGCAVLMFKNSASVADKLADVLNHVIAVSGDIQHGQCRRFSEIFYQMLGAGRTVPDAYAAAITVVPRANDGTIPFSIRGRGVRDSQS